MQIHRGLILAAGFAAASACASAGTTGGAAAPAGGSTQGAAASLPQVQCPAGAPASTPQALAAQAAINRTLLPTLSDSAKRVLWTEAQTQARAGIAADPNNPTHHFQLGQAAVSLNNYVAADSAFRRTVELCPAFSAEVTPIREQAAGAALDAGEAAYNRQDTAAAMVNWEVATRLSTRYPGALFRMAEVYSARNDPARAAPAYRQALAALERETPDTANADVNVRLRAASLSGLLNLGVQHFQRNQLPQAAALFKEVHTANPNHRDAWLNHAVVLYKQENWQELIPVANRLVQMDPLNYDMRAFLFNAYKGLADAAKRQNNAAVERTNRALIVSTLGAADSLPVRVQNVQLTNREGGARVAGTVASGAARQGTPVRMEFTFYGPTGPVGTQTVNVSAPAKDQTAPFEVTLATPQPVLGWSYRVGN